MDNTGFTKWNWVAPARERGLKYMPYHRRYGCRSVAPARERGLKSIKTAARLMQKSGRSREGAWIEIDKARNG